MSVRTRNDLGLLSKVDHALEVADKKHTFENGLSIAREIIGLLGIENAQADIKSFQRLKANPSWTKNAPDYEDRKASFALAENNDRNIDFKLYWVTKPAKRIVSNLVALTPNFEDEAFYSNKNVGIDFVLPDKPDRLIVVLSNNYKIRILEIHRYLSNTQKRIFEKWVQEFDFSNKAQVHKVLWDSFDIQPLNKEFYFDISSFFNELIQHLEREDILDKKHRSQFVSRLIGRIIFCWFLKKKEIISEDIGYFDINGKPATDYYAQKLETLFFKVLNTPLEERGFGIDDKTPFLNGGLFEEKESDLAGRGELSFPSDYFDRFYSFLNRYNFTTDESTSDFQQVAIDPEMLGRIFENLLAEEIEETGDQARKAKGAFYTPREIVDYMCRESLRAYVSEKFGEDDRKAEVLQVLFDKKEHELDPKSVLGKLGSCKNKIIEALDEIKIIDPACGSGAFPIGMLQIMLSIYERLDTRLDHYKTKLAIIKNNIFGVDIEPMAVEISRLRTWLSLVVDSVIKPSEKNKGIEELPNLDFKFICANSLIPLELESGLFDNKEMAENMQAIRDRYFKTNSLRIKDKMKRDFEEILKKNQSMFVSRKQKQLLTYHPFNSDNVCEFFDSEFMFGLSCFDVVVANPPYVDSEQMVRSNEGLRDQLSDIYSTARGNWDLYVPFFERSFGLLRSKGILAFITPNKWLSMGYAKSLRDFLTENLYELCDCAGADVFEAGNNPVITFVNKGIKREFLSIREFNDEYKIVRNSEVSRDLLLFQSWGVVLAKNIDFVLKVKKAKHRVGDCFDVENPFTVSEAYELSECIQDQKRDDLKKQFRFVNTGTIDPFRNLWGQKVTTYLKKKYSNPVIERAKLKTLMPRRYQQSSSPKIIISGMRHFESFIDYSGDYVAGKSTVIIRNPKGQCDFEVLLAILNSKTLKLYLKETYGTSGIDGGISFTAPMISELPFPDGPAKIMAELKRLAKNICALTAGSNINENSEKLSAFDGLIAQVDELVMDLYKLTKEEREIINKS